MAENHSRFKDEKNLLLRIGKDVGLLPKDRMEAIAMVIWLKLNDEERKAFVAHRAKQFPKPEPAALIENQPEPEPAKKELPEHLK